MDEESVGPLFPIGAVAERTGLSTHVLRAWERRYGAVVPRRVEGGGRVYDDADIIKLRLLKRATDSGHLIGGIANLSNEKLLELLRDGSSPRLRQRKGDAKVQMAEILASLDAMDGSQVHGLLMRSLVMMGSERFIGELVVPLLYKVGELWHSGSIFPVHEHLFSAALRRVLDWMMEQLAVVGGGPTLVTTTPLGQRHEMGALVSGVVAAEEGWRVEYLGADLPADDIARAATGADARAIALSVVHETSLDELRAELSTLHSKLEGDVTILVGGRAALEYREALVAEGVIFVPDLGSLRGHLRRLAQDHHQETG